VTIAQIDDIGGTKAVYKFDAWPESDQVAGGRRFGQAPIWLRLLWLTSGCKNVL